jgi:DNA-binding winged helix-turn-helix (wHTH) protein
MRVRFGNVQADSGSRQLWRESREVHLTPKAFDLLMLLIEQRPKVVSKSRIQAQLWPDAFVSEGNLPVIIGEVRRAIGDARPARFIRTVHGFGYAFSAPVEILSESEDLGGPARCWLVHEAHRITLMEGEHVLGREGPGVIPIESSTVSRRHARIVVTNGDAEIEDLGSKNGTLVRNQPVEGRKRLQDGDRIQLGSVLLTFRRSPAAGTTETQPPESSPSPEAGG